MTDRLEDMIDQLKTLRDEVIVQAHLGKAEMKDELEDIEQKWHAAQGKFEEVTEDATEVADEVRQTVNVITQELSEAYKRIKVRLDD